MTIFLTAPLNVQLTPAYESALNNPLMALVVGVGAASVTAMAVLALANICMTAQSSWSRNDLDRDRLRRRMERLTDLNLSAVMPAVIGLYGTSVVFTAALGQGAEIPYEGSGALLTVLLVVIPVGLYLSLVWLTAALDH